jgi:predicted nucleic-acid-binding protein
MSAYVDTNVLIRHLTGDPPLMAQRATAFLVREEELFLVDLIVAQTVYVLESVYGVGKPQIAQTIRSAIAMKNMVTSEPSCLLRALEVYESYRLDFSEAYLVACSEISGIWNIASFDKSIDRVATVRRIEP